MPHTALHAPARHRQHVPQGQRCARRCIVGVAPPWRRHVERNAWVNRRLQGSPSPPPRRPGRPAVLSKAFQKAVWRVTAPRRRDVERFVITSNWQGFMPDEPIPIVAGGSDLDVVLAVQCSPDRCAASGARAHTPLSTRRAPAIDLEHHMTGAPRDSTRPSLSLIGATRSALARTSDLAHVLWHTSVALCTCAQTQRALPPPRAASCARASRRSRAPCAQSGPGSA